MMRKSEKNRRNSFFMTQLDKYYKYKNKYYQVMPVKSTNVVGLLFLDLNFKK